MIRCVPTFVVCAVLSSTPHIQAGSNESANAALVRTARSGAWSAAETWVGGKIPRSGDRVQICTNHRVIYDLSASPPIRSIHVAGTLVFAPDRDTCLEVGLIKIQPGDDASEVSIATRISQLRIKAGLDLRCRLVRRVIRSTEHIQLEFACVTLTAWTGIRVQRSFAAAAAWTFMARP